MDSSATSSLPFLLVNLAFAVIALGVGFVAGAWFLGGSKNPSNPGKDEDEGAGDEEQLAVERAALASSRLKDLATGVATDVGQHSSLVEEITAGLLAAKDAPAAQQTSEVASALSQIVEANEKLQTRLSKAEEQIQAQAAEIRAHESEARTDSLTMIANRRAFDDQLSQRFAEWQRKATPFSLLILDVDHFKKFNDTHGHQAGDEVLRHVARALQSAAREMDIPCRYGGEEFAVILPATIARDASGMAERVRRAIESLRIEFEGKTLSVTASVGLAEVSHADNEQGLLRRADDALYASKDAGRNCGHLHDGERCVPVVGATKPDANREVQHPSGASVPTKLLDQLPTRTRFSDELRRRISATERSGEPLSVLAANIRGYRSLCEEYGEDLGRLTLDSVAQFLQNTLRDMDLLGHIEDGQFVIMLPSASLEQAEKVAQRAGSALAKCSVPLGGQDYRLEADMGVADCTTDDTAASLIRRATEAARTASVRPTAAV